MVQVQGKNLAMYKIDSLEKAMKNMAANSSEEDIITVGMELGDAYQGYTVKYSSDTLAPFYTMKLGQIYEHILKDAAGASEYYQQALIRYPEYPHKDEVLFHLGNLYQAEKRPEAKGYYERIIKDFPKSVYKNDALSMLQIMDDSSLNATIHRFEKENQKKKESGAIQ